jgi:hypothetical protein
MDGWVDRRGEEGEESVRGSEREGLDIIAV